MKPKKILNLGIIFILIIIIITGCKSENTNRTLTRTEFLMDTVITLRIYDKQDGKILDEAVDRVKEIEKMMSKTIKNSDVNLINENAGIKPVQVHEDVYYVIDKAKHFASITDGAYEPTIGPLVELWDITSEGEQERDSIPTEEEINESLELVDYNDLELMDDNYVYLKREGMKLDLGGIVKGYAADEVKEIFVENGVQSAIIDLGGNLYVVGGKENGDPWKIGIQDPAQVKGNYVGIFKAEDQSIVTSGDYERYFTFKGKKYHHIIDSKTGYPSENEVTGISIISDNSIDGDALSTALFVSGVERGTELVDQLENSDVIFITKDNKVFIQEKLIEQFSLGNNEFELINNTN